MPKISVIVPVYNVERYLDRCVQSILNQTYTDFELILVDDGSPDNCAAMCDDYAEKDGRVKVIHQKNGGLSAARNAGIVWVFANSDSEWITFIDSDDWVHPEYLERLLNAAVENHVDVSVCGFEQTEGEQPAIEDEQMSVQLWKPEDYYVEHNINAIVAWGKLYRKECFRKIRYPLGKIHEDEFTTYKILFTDKQIAIVSSALYYYYQNQEGIMNSPWNLENIVAYDALEEQISFFSEHGYYNARRSVIRRYLKSISDRIMVLSKQYDCNREILVSLKQRKKCNFAKFAKLLNVSDAADAWVLTQVFPIRMQLYWWYCFFLRKAGIRTDEL